MMYITLLNKKLPASLFIKQEVIEQHMKGADRSRYLTGTSKQWCHEIEDVSHRIVVILLREPFMHKVQCTDREQLLQPQDLPHDRMKVLAIIGTSEKILQKCGIHFIEKSPSGTRSMRHDLMKTVLQDHPDSGAHEVACQMCPFKYPT